MKEKILISSGIIILIIIIANLAVLDINWFRKQEDNLLKTEEITSKLIPTSSPSVAIANPDSCGSICQKTINEKITELVATLSGKKTITEAKTITKSTSSQTVSQPQTIYIPLGGGGTTTNKDWTDVGNAAVYFDLNDYPNFSEARFEGFIKVLNGNGKVYARLYDATHNIGVQGSDIEAIGESFSLVASDKLNFWQGKNLYRIQIKSLNGYEAAVDSGRIKLILK